MKTVIAIWNRAGQGKSSTLRAVAKLLVKTYKDYKPIHPEPFEIPDEGDFEMVMKTKKGTVIGIISKGDPGTGLKRKLIRMRDEYKCDIILCSTRTKGKTIWAVSEEFKNYNVIWTSTYETLDDKIRGFVNEKKAEHILDLLQNLERI
jgi:hypothetical protein